MRDDYTAVIVTKITICRMKAIILENIRSLNNVGAIIRTADGA